MSTDVPANLPNSYRVAVKAGPLRRRPPEVHLFVLWSEARFLEQRILEDIEDRFTVLDVVEVTWTPGDIFARNLTRMYGDALPPGSDKEIHCGSGPFLAVVARDENPQRGIRRTNRGPKRLNSSVFDARSRYRQWTGGGYRVHASDSVAEAERNTVLLLGRRPAEFGHTTAPAGVDRGRAGDPIGTHGWNGLDQLVLALEAHGCSLVSLSTGPDGDAVTLRTPDRWWAEHIAGGRAIADGVREVRLRNGSARVTLVEVPATPTFDWVRTVRPWIRRVRRLRDAVLPIG